MIQQKQAQTPDFFPDDLPDFFPSEGLSSSTRAAIRQNPPVFKETSGQTVARHNEMMLASMTGLVPSHWSPEEKASFERDRAAGAMATPGGGVITAGMGVDDVMEGNVARGGHKIISGLATTALPFAPGAAVAAPIRFGATALMSYLAGKAARTGSQYFGANEEQQQFAEDLGNVGGGVAVNSVSPSMLRKMLMMKVVPPVSSELTPQNLVEALRNRTAVPASEDSIEQALRRGTGTTAEPLPNQASPPPVNKGANPAMREPVARAEAFAETRSNLPANQRQMATGQSRPAVNPKVELGPGAEGLGGITRSVSINGKTLGSITYEIKGDTAVINNVGGPKSNYEVMSNALGRKGVQAVSDQIMRDHPEVKYFEGIRVGGARGEEARSLRVPASKVSSPEPTEPQVPKSDADMMRLLLLSLRKAKASNPGGGSQ